MGDNNLGIVTPIGVQALEFQVGGPDSRFYLDPPTTLYTAHIARLEPT